LPTSTGPTGGASGSEVIESIVEVHQDGEDGSLASIEASENFVAAALLSKKGSFFSRRVAFEASNDTDVTVPPSEKLGSNRLWSTKPQPSPMLDEPVQIFLSVKNQTCLSVKPQPNSRVAVSNANDLALADVE
jgi:hypothetical protein